jgi:O-antigen ligase
LVPPPFLRTLSLILAVAAASSILLSIAVSQILLALALGVLLLSGLPLRWPRIAVPLGLFLIWTLLSMAFSPDPGAGLPQVRKMLVFAMLLIVYSAVRTLREAKWLVTIWVVAGAATAARGLWQFAGDVAGARAEHRDFYHYYVADRIRGFMSHWMTFSGQELFVLLLAAAYLMFAPRAGRRIWLWLAAALLVGIALLLSDTRSVWVAALVAGVYLLWSWNRWSVAAVPVALAVAFLASPSAVRQRVESMVHPEKQTDSNEHRIVCWLTGWQMIKAHPVFGVGPEEIAKRSVFDSYVPANIQRPLPDGWYGHLHDIYVHYAAERGVPAALILTGALLMALADFRRALRHLAPGRSDRRFLLEAAVACLIGTMVSGIFELNLGDTEVLTMFLAIVCLGYLAASGTAEAAELPLAA